MSYFSCSYRVAAPVIAACLTIALFLAGCSEAQRLPASASAYDANSAQQLVPASCQAYFDGCNNCRRNPEGGVAACTRKACASYARPYCLDPREFAYRCDGGAAFTLHYGEYRSDHQAQRLAADQVMFDDGTARGVVLLTREPTASGERYSNGAISVFAKGREAFVEEHGNRLYTNCSAGESTN